MKRCDPVSHRVGSGVCVYEVPTLGPSREGGHRILPTCIDGSRTTSLASLEARLRLSGNAPQASGRAGAGSRLRAQIAFTVTPPTARASVYATDARAPTARALGEADASCAGGGGRIPFHCSCAWPPRIVQPTAARAVGAGRRRHPAMRWCAARASSLASSRGAGAAALDAQSIAARLSPR